MRAYGIRIGFPVSPPPGARGVSLGKTEDEVYQRSRTLSPGRSPFLSGRLAVRCGVTRIPVSMSRASGETSATDRPLLMLSGQALTRPVRRGAPSERPVGNERTRNASPDVNTSAVDGFDADVSFEVDQSTGHFYPLQLSIHCGSRVTEILTSTHSASRVGFEIIVRYLQISAHYGPQTRPAISTGSTRGPFDA